MQLQFHDNVGIFPFFLILPEFRSCLYCSRSEFVPTALCASRSSSSLSKVSNISSIDHSRKFCPRAMVKRNCSGNFSMIVGTTMAEYESSFTPRAFNARLFASHLSYNFLNLCVFLYKPPAIVSVHLRAPVYCAFLFRFVSNRFVSNRFVSNCFVSNRFVSNRFFSFRTVSFLFEPFLFFSNLFFSNRLFSFRTVSLIIPPHTCNPGKRAGMFIWKNFHPAYL